MSSEKEADLRSQLDELRLQLDDYRVALEQYEAGVGDLTEKQRIIYEMFKAFMGESTK